FLELAVAVAQNDPRLVAGADARNYRSPIPAIDRMMNDLEMWIAGGQTIRDFASAVAAAVVDHDDFVPFGDLGKFSFKRRCHPFDVAFLVMTGQEDADA